MNKLQQSDIPGVIEPLRKAKAKWYDGIQQTQETWHEWFQGTGRMTCSLCKYYSIQYVTSFSCNKCVLKTSKVCAKEFDVIDGLYIAVMHGEAADNAEAFETFFTNATTMYNNICVLLDEAERMASEILDKDLTRARGE